MFKIIQNNIGWKRIKYVPKWLISASNKYASHHVGDPNGQEAIFRGKFYMYKVKFKRTEFNDIEKLFYKKRRY